VLARTFVIAPVAARRLPELALERAAERRFRFVAEAFARYYPFEPVGLSPQTGASVPAEQSKWRSQPAQEQFDAVLYCSMRLARIAFQACSIDHSDISPL